VELQYQPDLDKVLERFEAWWQCELLDRPLVEIHVRRETQPELPTKSHASLRDRWMDVEYNLDRFEASLEGAVLLAETVPIFIPSLGPEVCATVFGCELEFSEGTSWSIPVAGSCRQVMDIRPDLDNVYWQNLRAQADASIERGRGRWITGLPDLHTNGDLVAALRDPQDLCLELADDIDAVRAACDYVTDVSYERMYEDMWRRIEAAGQPCTTWTPALHAGPSYPVSCDLICMVSPHMFRRTILPSLVWEMRYLERSIFHLDGPDALRHLDDLLAQPELNGLQWVYGAGQGPARKWIDVYRRAQAAGKCLQILCENADDARALAEHLRPEGVWFCVGGSYRRDEAEAFVDWSARWAAGKRA
jgi:hypothetical protein